MVKVVGRIQNEADYLGDLPRTVLDQLTFPQINHGVKKQARPGRVVPLKGTANILSLGIALIEPLSTIFEIFHFQKAYNHFCNTIHMNQICSMKFSMAFFGCSNRVIDRSWSCLNITGSKTWPVDNVDDGGRMELFGRVSPEVLSVSYLKIGKWFSNFRFYLR